MGGTGRVVVVGSGIVGATAAWRLARRGADVVLVESGAAGQATAAGAGIVAPWRAAPATGPWAAYCDLAAITHPQLVAELTAEAGVEVGYTRVGGLVVSEDADAMRALAGELTGTAAARGWTTLGDVAYLPPAGAAARFPVLREDLAAVWTAGTGRLDGRVFRDALTDAAQRAGATHRSGRAKLVREGDRVTGVRLDGEVLGADVVVAAAGAWTTELCRPLGIRLALAPMRGQIVHFQLPGGADTAGWPTVRTHADEYGHHYLLAFPGGRVVVGATREPGAGFDHRVTAAGQRQVLDAALALAPGLADATVLETRVGFRPVSADDLPLLGAVPGLNGLLVATGLGANGLTYGPLMGELAAGVALGEPPPIDLAPFRPDR